MPDSLRRLAPLSGVLFAALLVVTFTTPETPGVHDTGAQVISSYQHHHSAHMIGDISGGLAVVFFLFFISSLHSFFRDKEGGHGLATGLLAGGILIAVGGAIFTSLDVALIDARNHISPDAAQALNVLSNDFFFPFEIGLIVFSLCSGLAILATAALPKWLGWISVAIGIVAFTPVGFFAFFITLIWSAIVAVLVYRRSAPGATSAQPVPAAA